MVVPISSGQQELLQHANIDPIFLVDISSTAGTMRFSTKRALWYGGNLYQPYLSTVGTLRTAGTFPENNTSDNPLQLQFNNEPIEFDGFTFEHLSETFFPVFPWELAEVQVRLLLVSGTEDSIADDIAIPWVTSGTAGVPNRIDREKFLLPVHTANQRLQDSIPLRVVSKEVFPEADRDEVGASYLPILVGSGVTVRARATTAGATTTVRTASGAGTALEVTDVAGFGISETIIIGGMINDSMLISTIDEENQILNLSADLSTLPNDVQRGMVVREDRSSYAFTVADHRCAGDAIEVKVIQQGATEPVLVDPAKYSTETVTDSNAIGGERTDIVITELLPFGSPDGGVTQQPETSVPGGNHNHSVSITQATTIESFANGTSGGINWNLANDGNGETAGSVSSANPSSKQTGTFTTHSTLGGVFDSQRYHMSAQVPSNASNSIQMRRSTTAFLTITTTTAKGSFRSTKDTGGSSSTDWSVVCGTTSATQCDCFEGYKAVDMLPSVSEDTKDLSSTNLDTDVEVSGADIEVGHTVEVTINGIEIPDDSGLYGPVTASGEPVERPDGICRWFLERAIGASGIIDEASYAEAAQDYEDEEVKLRFAVTEPIRLNTFFDTIADNSRSMNWWRDGHNLKLLTSGIQETTLREDEGGVISIDWQTTSSTADIRNDLVGFYDKDWTGSKTKAKTYAGSVLGINATSQAFFGVRSNEVSEKDRSKAYFFDMVPTFSGAQNVINRIIDYRAFPRKQFQIDTDWTHLGLEPGDRIEVDSAALTSPVQARVIENSVDSRLMCRIVAAEIGIPNPAPHYTSSQVGVLQNLDETVLGIGNEWTVGIKFKFVKEMEFTGVLFRTQPTNPFSNVSLIQFNWKPAPFGDYLEIHTFDNDGINKKQYRWDSIYVGIADVWYSLFVSWNGTDLQMWTAPIGSMPSSPITPDWLADDDDITMGTPGRGIQVVTNMQNLYELAIWNRELTQLEINYIDSFPQHNLTVDAGDYAARWSLMHYWRLFADRGDPGRDFGLSPFLIDVNKEGNLDASKIRYDAP